ncbi:MAG: hypothetical protein IT317_04080 [Anaerolineales bacterium]|nr:hypothetical protein [Anaerolineales bacterium]
MRLKPYNFTDYKGIAFTFGFPVPRAFAAMISGLYEFSRGDARKVFEMFERLTHLMLDGANARYQQTPPELFPIASLGVDGVHYGYVLHAPEIESADYPIAQFAPMDRAGITLVGQSTAEALENIIGDTVEAEQDEWQRQELERLSQMLGLRPAVDRTKKRQGIDDYARPVEPSVPPDWAYVPTSDGAGVLAPSDRFAALPIEPIAPYAKADSYLHEADHAMAQGHPAAALYYLREGYWYHWTDHQVARRFSYRLATTYEELKRPLLAEVCAWRVKHYFS